MKPKYYLSSVFFILILATPILSQWLPTGPEGGSIFCLARCPVDTTCYFAGTIDGGLYQSRNRGQNWQSNSETLDVPLITNIVFKSDTLFVTTLVGLFKSLDFGVTWEKLFSNLGILNGLAIHPLQSQIMYIGMDFGSAGAMMYGTPGVWRSLDGGKNWEPINEGLTNLNVTSLKISPHNPATLYATTRGGLFVSYQGGEDGWQNLSGDLGEILATGIEIDEFGMLYLATMSGLFKSMNNGQSWFELTHADFSDRFIQLHAFQMTTPDGNGLWIGTRDGLFQSTDGGATWKEKCQGLVTRNIFAFQRYHAGCLLLGTTDGFYQSTDDGEHWTRQVQGMSAYGIQQFTFLPPTAGQKAWAVTNSAMLFATEKTNLPWQQVPVPADIIELECMAVNPLNPGTLYLGTIIRADSNPTHQMRLFRSYDTGQTWHKIPDALTHEYINHLVIDYQDTLVMYAATMNNKILKSNDGGYTWQPRSNGIPGSNVLSLVQDLVNPARLYAGAMGNYQTEAHGIYTTSDGGATWEFTSKGMLRSGWNSIYDIAINPQRPATLFAASEENGIYKSIDGGANWRILVNGIPAYSVEWHPFYSVTIDPVDTNRIYAAGMEVYFSQDAGQHWEKMMTGLPDFFGNIRQIRVDPTDHQKIYAATMSRGVWIYHHTTSEMEPEIAVSPPRHYDLAQNFPNPFNPETTMHYDLPANEFVTLEIFNLEGQLIEQLVNQYQAAGHYSVRWNAVNTHRKKVSSGIYLYRLRAGTFQVTKKMTLLQ